MKKYLEFLTERGINCFSQDRIPIENYDGPSSIEEKRIYDPKKFLETNPLKGKKQITIDPEFGSLFKFFLDGARRTYKVGDALIDDSYMPIIAGQVGAACCVRENKQIQRYSIDMKSLIVLPDLISELIYNEIKESIEKTTIKGVKLEVIDLKFKEREGKMEDQSIAKINSEMQKMELDIIKKMHKDRILEADKMLILDGALTFKRKIPNEEMFRHVVGVAKSFNSNLKEMLKNKNKEIGTILQDLELGERTPVFKIENGNMTIGAWYLRIRNRQYVRNPLEGIIKIEKVALESEGEHIDGLDSGLVDNISLSLLNERLPVCYGVDNRWPSHLYPIYLTERFLKSSYKSNYHFLNVF